MKFKFLKKIFSYVFLITPFVLIAIFLQRENKELIKVIDEINNSELSRYEYLCLKTITADGMLENTVMNLKSKIETNYQSPLSKISKKEIDLFFEENFKKKP